LAAHLEDLDPTDNSGRYVLGMGCERGAPVEDVTALALSALEQAGITPSEILALGSIDAKTEEPAILATAALLGVAARFFDAATLERETPRLANPSDLVFARVGCHGVAEAAALAAAGTAGVLVVPKIKSAFATAAIARIV
jgi:cobalamin biosynthesis protein CbiG